jgi:uncharacterized membrane-anchored protein YitT (DUF2179 family)
MTGTPSLTKTLISQAFLYFWMALGAFLAAFAIDVFLIPNKLIDGGIVGVAMIFGNIFGKEYIPTFFIILNIPFIYLAYKSIGKTFLIHMLVAVLLFVASLFIIGQFPWKFNGESLEVVVIGGAILGIGIGMIIRVGGCLDGTEILGIIINRRTGFTVGQVVLFCNVFIFGALGFVVNDWHPPLLSLITYLVVHKVMDAVIVGLDETKSITIISKKSKAIADALMHELGLGLTIMYGRGGFTGDEREIIYVIVERLQLADVKDIIFREDPTAFMAIENLHEVANGKQGVKNNQTVRLQNIISKILGKK